MKLLLSCSLCVSVRERTLFSITDFFFCFAIVLYDLTVLFT